MRHSTKLYREVESLMNTMANVESEYRRSPTMKSRRQLLRIYDRLQILSEVIRGMTK